MYAERLESRDRLLHQVDIVGAQDGDEDIKD